MRIKNKKFTLQKSFFNLHINSKMTKILSMSILKFLPIHDQIAQNFNKFKIKKISQLFDFKFQNIYSYK